jgi:drug/metabolite transporter (DMT)-like permease
VIALVAWNIGIAKLGAATAVLFMNVVPITAFAIAIGFGAHYPAIEYLGAAITILALALNSIVARPRMRPVLAAVEGDRSAFDHQRGVA